MLRAQTPFDLLLLLVLSVLTYTHTRTHARADRQTVCSVYIVVMVYSVGAIRRGLRLYVLLTCWPGTYGLCLAGACNTVFVPAWVVWFVQWLNLLREGLLFKERKQSLECCADSLQGVQSLKAGKGERNLLVGP